MITIDKKLIKIDKSRILCDLDLLLKTNTRNLKFGFWSIIFYRQLY